MHPNLEPRNSHKDERDPETRNLQLNGSSKGTNRARSSAATALSTSLLQPRSAVSHALDLLLAKQHEHMSVATDARSARGAAPKRATTALTARNVAGSRRKWRASAEEPELPKQCECGRRECGGGNCRSRCGAHKSKALLYRDDEIDTHRGTYIYI